MAFAALGIVGVRVLSLALATGAAAVVLDHYDTTAKSVKDKLTHWLSSKYKPPAAAAAAAADDDDDINININDVVVGRNDEDSELLVLLPTTAAAEKTDEEEAPAAAVGPAAPLNLSTHRNMKDDDSSNKSSSSCYFSQQQPQPEQLRKMEEEEAADDGFITSGLKSDDQQSELLVLLPTATEKREEEAAAAAAVVDPAAPLNLFIDINMKESSSSSLWMRMKKKVSEICGRVKSVVRRWEGEVVEWWRYLKDPDFWDGKTGRFSKDIFWLVIDFLFEAIINRNKGALFSTVHLQMFVRRLYTILKTNIK